MSTDFRILGGAPVQSGTQEALVTSFVALENYLSEIRSVSVRDEILTITLRHLSHLLSIETAGFFLPRAADQEFTLQTRLPAEGASTLTRLVGQAIDSGVFGWALQHYRPVIYRPPDDQGSLILAVLRTRGQVLGMFAAIPSPTSIQNWDVSRLVLGTHLSCASDALLNEALTMELTAHNRKLDALVHARTEQLLQAKEAAELANRTQSRFLASMSHELRTPLNVILGYTQLLLGDGSLTPSQQTDISSVQDAGERLLALINHLLEVTVEAASAFKISPASVDLETLVAEIATVGQAQADDKGLEFHTRLDSDLPRSMVVDPKRLKQVLLNLLGNAFRYTSAGLVDLSIQRHGRAVRFIVSDTGPGIGEEDLPVLFHPARDAGGRTSSGQGAGLGLPISYRILHLMGTELRVRTKVGQGTSFWFDLADANLPEALALPPSQISSPQETAGDFSPLPEGLRARLNELLGRGDILASQQELEGYLAKTPSGPSAVPRLLELIRSCRLKAARELLKQL